MPRRSTQLRLCRHSKGCEQGKWPGRECAELRKVPFPHTRCRSAPNGLLPATADCLCHSFVVPHSVGVRAGHRAGVAGSIAFRRVNATTWRLFRADSLTVVLRMERQRQAAAPSRRCQPFRFFFFFPLFYFKVPGARAGCAFQRQDWISKVRLERVCLCVRVRRLPCVLYIE